MKPFKLLTEMLELQREHGGAVVKATAGTWNQLKRELAALRRENPSLYAVKLCAKHLPPAQQFRAPTGGLVVVELHLVARNPEEHVSGPQAAELRARGQAVDGQTFAMTPAEVDETIKLEREHLAFEMWKRANPNGTFEEACAAGHRAEAEADRLANEIREKLQQKTQTTSQDKFAEALRKAGFTGFEDEGGEKRD